MYLRLEQIQTLQIDHTSRCNLRCPQCGRTSSNGGVNPDLPLGRDLGVDDYSTILAPFRHRPMKIFFCGNFGDAAASPTFVDVIDHCREFAPLAYYVITTNGSLQNPQWWERLAQKISHNPESRVSFSIDGLEDTNGIYRINSRFERIVENLKAFNRAGGRSRWDYLLFEHNRHQVELARELAIELGVAEFNVKNTSRFLDAENGTYNPSKPGRRQNLQDLSDNPSRDDFNSIVAAHGSFSAYAARAPISCKSKMERSIFIDFDMRVWPCCWMGATQYAPGRDEQGALNSEVLLKRHGSDFNRLDVHGWSVLDHPYFFRELEQSWSCDFGDMVTPRSLTCGRTCGDKFEFSSGYGKNRNVEVLV